MHEIITAVLIILVPFLLLRDVALWYLKVNQRLAVEREILEQLRRLNMRAGKMLETVLPEGEAGGAWATPGPSEKELAAERRARWLQVGIAIVVLGLAALGYNANR